jgi:hypothetical protein
MKSLAEGLPPEIARQVHPDWRKNEAAYWAVRDQLLGQYQDQWIGFANGMVVASGARPVVVFHAAHQAAEHPFVVCVGREQEPYRLHRANFVYDTSYQCQLHANFVGAERILGRDVLNSLDVLFRGPSGEVIVNP